MSWVAKRRTMASGYQFMIRAIFVPWKHGELYEDYRTRGAVSKTFLTLVLMGLAFSVTSLTQATSGNFPAVPVILPLSLENYFFWQTFLIIPWLILSWFLVTTTTRLMLIVLGARKTSFRQLLAFSGLSFSSCLFFLWIPHLLTTVFYLLGGSQKEWVEGLSEPGWLQTIYLVFIVLGVLSGWQALSLSLVKKKLAKNQVSILTSSFNFLVWLVLLAILLR